MNIIMELDQITQIILISLVVIVIWNLILCIKLMLISKKIKKFTRGGKTADFEKVIEVYINEADEMKNNIEENSKQINIIMEKISNLKGRVEMMRYNAFGEEGQDLSYSIVFLDEKMNGVVISSIYNRGESSTYGKPIVEGNSKYKLSREESIVLEKAMQKK